MKKALAVALVLVGLTGCGQSLEERVKVAKQCHEAGGYVWEDDILGDAHCSMSDKHR